MTQTLPASLYERLTQVDTPTVCNALEFATGKRDITGFTYGTLIAAPRPLPSIVGFARTLRVRAASPSPLDGNAARERRLAYYRYVAPQNGVPVIVVQEDLDHSPGIGSFWGEVNSTVHKGLGCKGVLTNGSVRDLGDLAEGFPILAGSLGPSHAHVHIVDFDQPVSVFGMQVKPGDLVHADRHGAVIIPASVFDDLERCINLTFAKEKPLLEAARRPGFSVADIEKALQQSADIH